MMSSASGLVMEAVQKQFDGRAVLTDVSLSVPPGRVCSLVGANGSGKSTLLNVCMGYIPHDGGRIVVAGADLRTQAIAARMKTAFVPDVARLYAHLSAVENLMYFESLRGVRATRAQCLATLERLGLPTEAADQRARTYSKGMRQKVSLAMGVLKKAEVFLLDEPSSGLDAASSEELLRILRYVADEGNAVLFSTHHWEMSERVADVVARLQDGKVYLDAVPSRGAGPRVDG